MSKIVCFGEIMLRLSPPNNLRIVQANTFDVSYGGGEANVSVSLANFNMNTAFVTKVPDNLLGQSAINDLRKYGVDTSGIMKGGDRLGIYYLETGASQRSSKVIYDRKFSSISELKCGEIDWNEIFKNSEWFHFTGITPALNDCVADATLEACKIAKEKGLTVSCDLNYRKNLWSTDKANIVMSKLMQYVDICIANEEDADKVFGIKAKDTDISGGKLSHDGYKQVAVELRNKFGFSKVAITLRESISASDNNWGAMLFDGDDYFFSEKYAVHIVDRVGGGDSFGAGLIYGIINGFSQQKTIDFATAASCLKHSINGDFKQVTVSEVYSLMGGDGSGRVQR